MYALRSGMRDETRLDYGSGGMYVQQRHLPQSCV